MLKFFKRVDAYEYRQDVQQIAQQLHENPPPCAVPALPSRPVGRPPKKRDAESVLAVGAAHADTVTTNSSDNKRSKYQHWFSSPYILDILAAHRRANFNSRQTVKLLRKESPDADRYKHLSHTTIFSWFDADNKLLPARQMELDAGVASVKGVGFCSPLAEAEGAEKRIVEVLLDMRKAGTPLNTRIIRWVMHAILERRNPDVLEKLQLSQSFISRWVRTHEDLKFAWRARTTTASHLPDDWETQGINMSMRIAAAMHLHSVSNKAQFCSRISALTLAKSSDTLCCVLFADTSLSCHQYGSDRCSSRPCLCILLRTHRQLLCRHRRCR